VARAIFDDVVRSDPRPAHEEDSFSFLNRVSTPYWQRVRVFIEEAFAAYPDEHALDLRARFRDRRWSEHVGAWWELYLFTLFQALGYEVEVHPELAGVSTRPDFRVGTGESAVLVEARHVAAGIVSEPQLGRDEWITAPLDDLAHPNFMVGVRILERASQRPRRVAVTAGVLEWLDRLDPADAATQSIDSFPRFQGRAGRWRFELQALPVRAEARGREGRRLVGLYPGAGGWVNTAIALRAALKEKARRYGRPACPFVLAPLLTSGFLSIEDVVSALFGSEGIVVSTTSPERVEVVRERNGFWISGEHFRGTRVSAVLIGDALMPERTGGALPRLWIHPAAARPLTSDFGLPTGRFEPDGRVVLSESERTGADVFGLPSGWPGPEQPFDRAGSPS
jgi:hypothetical protein